jgi:hypothetical protein
MLAFLKSWFGKKPEQQSTEEFQEQLAKTYPLLFNPANYKIHPDVYNAEYMYQVEDHLEHTATGDLFSLKVCFDDTKKWWVSNLPLHIQYGLTTKEQGCLETFLVKIHEQLKKEYKDQKRTAETEKFKALYLYMTRSDV